MAVINIAIWFFTINFQELILILGSPKHNGQCSYPPITLHCLYLYVAVGFKPVLLSLFVVINFVGV